MVMQMRSRLKVDDRLFTECQALNTVLIIRMIGDDLIVARRGLSPIMEYENTVFDITFKASANKVLVAFDFFSDFTFLLPEPLVVFISLKLFRNDLGSIF